MKIEPNNIYCGDSYDLIKNIPDKSIDLVYIDIPYLIEQHGYGISKLGERMKKCDDELMGKKESIKNKINELQEKMDRSSTHEEYEKYRVQKNNQQNKLNLLSTEDLTKGIDYKIFDELVRVMKYIYIYMV